MTVVSFVTLKEGPVIGGKKASKFQFRIELILPTQSNAIRGSIREALVHFGPVDDLCASAIAGMLENGFLEEFPLFTGKDTLGTCPLIGVIRSSSGSPFWRAFRRRTRGSRRG